MQGEYWIETETADKVVDLIEIYCGQNWNYNQFMVSSFDWNALQQVAFWIQIRIGVLEEI
jgi:glycerophosphoryl diester phosphodiesterase